MSKTQSPTLEHRYKLICNAARVVCLKEDTLLEVAPPCKIFGDIHGQISDMLQFFRQYVQCWRVVFSVGFSVGESCSVLESLYLSVLECWEKISIILYSLVTTKKIKKNQVRSAESSCWRYQHLQIYLHWRLCGSRCILLGSSDCASLFEVEISSTCCKLCL